MAGLGALILVVGPSGAGKDTLLAGAARQLEATGRFHFAQRAITRPADAGGEDHTPITEDDFLNAEAEGGFLLSWRAHGLCYGLPRAPLAKLREDGVAIVANVSRSVIDDARARLQPMAVIQVEADTEALAERIAERGREAADDAALRVARARAFNVSGHDVFTVRNDGTIAAGIERMTLALEAASTAEWQAAE